VKECKPEFDRRGVSVVVVSFAEPAKLVHYQELHQWPFTMLADPERKAYRAFDLQRLSWFRVFSPATLKRYLQLLFKGMKREPYGGEDIYQSGGDFLLDREGNLHFAQRSQDPADRPAPARLLDMIDRFGARSGS
jgi:hypothetical protein